MRLIIRLIPLALACWAAFGATDAPQFTGKGELMFPADYREWVHMSSGLGMTYGPAAAATLDNPAFDNVYVHPASWKAFKESGKWPEGTMFVLEVRYSSSHGSINKGGFFQSDVAAIEAVVKDSKRYPRGWAYYGFGGGLRPVRQSSTPLDVKAGCNACHEANGAVENSFVQFYPAALEIAQQKGTLKASFHSPGPEASPARLIHTVAGLPDANIGRMLDEAKAADPSAGALREAALNQIGYGLLQDGKKASAVAVFEWTARAYPRSANAADSLAEAYEVSGKIAEARSATERSLELLDAEPSIAEDRKAALKKAIAERLARLK